uniref:Uncharacterized protein n=1 Tax=Salinispora arenicola (strain CNS-205) TaxID=391037 RepID=A8LX25_SALAI
MVNRQFVPLDVPWQNNCSFGVIDTTTGAMAKLPGNGEIRGVLLTVDGKVLVRRASGISVLDSSFTPLVEAAEPAEFDGLHVLAYQV